MGPQWDVVDHINDVVECLVKAKCRTELNTNKYWFCTHYHLVQIQVLIPTFRNPIFLLHNQWGLNVTSLRILYIHLREYHDENTLFHTVLMVVCQVVATCCLLLSLTLNPFFFASVKQYNNSVMLERELVDDHDDLGARRNSMYVTLSHHYFLLRRRNPPTTNVTYLAVQVCCKLHLSLHSSHTYITQKQ